MRLIAAALAVACGLLTGCSPHKTTPKSPWPMVQVVSQPEANLTDACISNFDPELDYFPERADFRHSSQLSVEYPQFNIHPRLWTLGIRAIPHADSLEATPLGRAEWMKLLGMLTNTEARANALFDRIERPYEAIARMVRGVPQRPLTLAGTASQRDVMELFGGANHRAALLRDAGGTFVLEGNTFPGSWYITSFERVYAAGADAPFWIGVRPGIPSVQALVAANPHHRWFETAIGSGQVYALDVGYRGMFAYHLEDQGLNNPHLQLAELVAVLHPGLAGRTKTAIESFFVRKLQ